MLAVLRRPEGLFRLEVERAAPFQPPPPGAPLEAIGEYVETVRPADPSGNANPELVRRALEVVDQESEPGPELLAAILHVLFATVPDPGAFDPALPPPRLDEATPRPRRAAAHPRGYRGTKVQPPRPARPRRIRALPYLDGGRLQARSPCAAFSRGISAATRSTSRSTRRTSAGCAATRRGAHNRHAARKEFGRSRRGGGKYPVP